MMLLNKALKFLKAKTIFQRMDASMSTWKFAKDSALTAEQFVAELEKIEKEEAIPFVVLDVREGFEIEIADLPKKINDEVELPKRNIPLRTLLEGKYDESVFPKDKSIVCLCHHGVRSAYAANYLAKKGIHGLNLMGGIDALSDFMEEIPRY